MTLRTPAALVHVLALCALVAHPGYAQAPRATPPTFAAQVETVRLDVSVLRSDGRVVTGLGPRDFEILEDGRPQEPTLFLRRELPISLVLLLDCSTSITDRLPLSQAAAGGFLDALGPQDRASVVEFNDRVRPLQPLTSDHQALRHAVTEVAAGGSTALYNALYVTLKGLPEGAREQELRRSAIVLLSDGQDTASLVWEEQVVELARRREAAIYVIDLRPPAETTRTARLLRVLSRESGGDVYHPSSIRDLDAVYSRISEELKSQYALGYVSSKPAHDGQWRRVQVRVRGQAALRVRHRTGYYAVP